ncbi:MAG: hypothetical protein JNM80_04865 [Phycisphaerae bacterium]|nr:hypothetical protein [Phycisphaerae bacterium]
MSAAADCGVVDCRERALAEPAYREQWPAILDRLQGPLCELAGEMDVSGAAARVVYWAPSSVVGVLSCPAHAGDAAARDAACRALAETSGLSLAEHPWALRPLATDTSATGRRHTLGVIERDSVADALHTWVVRAGLEPEGAVPGSAVGLIAAADEASAQSLASPCVAVHIGEQDSAIAVGAGGSLRLTRRLPIGADALLPPARPALQRCVAEIRDSVLVGLDEPDRPDAAIVCIGPGAEVPGLAGVLAEQCGLTLAPSGMPRDLDEILNADPPLILPRAVHAASQGRRLKRVLIAGFSAAGMLIAVDGIHAHSQLSSLQRQIERLRGRKSELEPVLATRRAALTLGQGVSAARAQIASRLGPMAAWDGVLALLAQNTPESIRLGSLSFSLEDGRAVCSIEGHAAGADSDATLAGYLDSLSTSSLVQDCRLGATPRTESGGSISFNLRMTITGLPSLAEVNP